MRQLGLTLFVWLALGTFVGHAQSAPPNYTHYTLEVTFNSDDHTISGREVVEYVNDTGERLEVIDFLLLANYDREPNPYLDPSVIDALYPQGFDSAWTRVRAVTDGAGQPLQYELLEGPAIWQTYSLKDTLLRVRLPEPLPPGESAELVIEFITKFPYTLRGDQAHYRGVYTWRFGWNPVALPQPLASIKDEERFVLPAAVYELTLTLPKDYQVAVGADHQETIRETDEEQTVHALNAQPTRSVPLAFSRDYRVYEFPYAEIPIAVYYLPGHEAAARQIATYAIESLQYYQERWGEYPRRRLLIAETPSARASFAGATGDVLLLLSRQLFSEKDLGVPGLLDRFLDYILAHEIAHQWWGIGIGADLNAESFLSESLAQYFSITYFEDKYGTSGPNVFRIERQGLLERFVETQFGYLNLREHFNELPYMRAVRNRFDEAIVKPQQDVKYANYSGERLYNKGYLMLRALHGLLGQETMDELLAAASERFMHKTITAEAFQALAEEISGQDLAEFFQNAFYRDEDESGEAGRAPYADYGIERVESQRQPDGTYRHWVTLTRRGQLRLPVAVVARAQGDEERTQVWALEDQLYERFVMTFETTSPLTEVEIDPEHLVPDVDRLNNTYVLRGLSLFNRRVKLIVTGENDLPLGSYLIRFNPLAGVLEGGYLLDHRWWLGNGFAALVKNFERGNSARVLVGWSGDGLIGQFIWTQTFFSHPTLGFPGRYWEPTDQLQLTLLRRPDKTGYPSLDKLAGATGRMATAFGLTWIHQEQLTRRSAYWASLLTDPMAFTRMELGGWQSFRIYPQANLGVQLSLGWGEGTLGIFQFDLRELVSFSDVEGYPFIAPVRLLGQIDVTFPLQRDIEFNLLGFAVARRVDDRFYLRFGRTWESLDGLTEGDLLADMKAEIGAEWRVQGTTLGGLFPWRFTLGLVYALTPVQEGQQVVKFYYSIWTPLF